jgi:hypothetical protein
MKKVFTSLSLIIFASLVLTACGGGALEAKEGTLTAARVAIGSMDPAAEFWERSPVLEVPTVKAEDPESGDGPAIMLQAAYDDTYLYVRAEWQDATESVLKKGWTWDGAGFEQSGNEDRIMFLFPITNNAEFSSKGCAEACHNTADSVDDWWMGSESEDVTYDAWHWKAARTGPVGYADDKWWGSQTDPEDYESARHGDEREGSHYSDNRTEDKSAPMYMNGADLSSPFIFLGDEVALDTSMLSAGDVVPGYVINRPDGSRGDIDAVGFWENGSWVVVLRRLLDTGNADDVVFIPPKAVPFGVSIVDDGGGLPHTVGPDVIVLEWE